LCHFIHLNDTCDNVNDPNSPGHNNPGGVYAPYVIPRYTRGGLQNTTIYYTMSTWNPYDVVLMRWVFLRKTGPRIISEPEAMAVL
jgi:hypothetical protein